MQHYKPIDTQDFELRIRRLEEAFGTYTSETNDRLTDLENRVDALEQITPGASSKQVSARQWQSALAIQGKLYDVRDVIPADATDPVNIQWFAAGLVREPPTVDPVWNFTKATLGYSDAQMTALNTLAHAQAS